MAQRDFRYKDIHPERTAISRRGPSKPLRLLLKAGLVKGRVLDYGCGKGADLTHLRSIGINAEGWDPFHRPQGVTGTFDTILCTYVLNVVGPEERQHIRNDILSLLAPNGTAYVTVRRDIDKGVTITSKGTYQEWVEVEDEWPEAHLMEDEIRETVSVRGPRQSKGLPDLKWKPTRGAAIYAVRRAFVNTLETRGQRDIVGEPTMEELQAIELEIEGEEA